MGRSRKASPKNLGVKLKQIRECLGATSYSEMIDRLNIPEANLYRSSIREFEMNTRTPSLLVLLRYSEISGIPMNDLVDDRVDLTERLPLFNR